MGSRVGCEEGGRMVGSAKGRAVGLFDGVDVGLDDGDSEQVDAKSAQHSPVLSHDAWQLPMPPTPGISASRQNIGTTIPQRLLE